MWTRDSVEELAGKLMMEVLRQTFTLSEDVCKAMLS
jgi:hypothetical protein